MTPLRILVTGGAGFIGSALCRRLIRDGHRVMTVDALTYAGNLSSLASIADAPEFSFVHADIGDGPAMAAAIRDVSADVVMHLAAETHVDRSIDAPAAFIRTNVVGTSVLLEAALRYWQSLDADRRGRFRFVHVSTDEVFGDLPYDGGTFDERSAYAPASPYAASKAAADHLVRAWGRTYGLPVLVTNCSNNYGPYHFPEKLIPLVILNAIEGKPIPVYGRGENVRDWLHVDDHVDGLVRTMVSGTPGETYAFGGRAERSNLAVVEAICECLDSLRPRAQGSHRDLIRFVTDRPGHDRRYAIDPARAERELGWRAMSSFESGLAETVRWYLDNEAWWRPIREQRYAGTRLGAGG